MSILGHLPTSLPVDDPVLIIAIVMLIMLIAPMLIKLLRVPAMIGLIVAGALIGPNVAGVLARDNTIVLLGTIGLLYIMFLAGLEIDLNEFAKSKVKSGVFGVLSFILPQVSGTFLGLALGYSLPGAILLGSVFSSHTLLAYPIASRLKIHKTESSTMAVGGTIITDVAALLVLAVIAGSRDGELDQTFWVTLGVGLTIYSFVVIVGLPRLGRYFFSKVEPEATAEYVFVLAALFVCSFMAEVAGVEAIVGAFLAGLTMNRLIPESSTLMNRINFVGNALFIPFFLLSVGMLVNPSVLMGGFEPWIVAGSMSVLVVIMKFLAAKLSQWIFGFSAAEGMVIFGLSIPQAAATLAATMIGYDIGLFNEETVNGVIVMILVTCVIGPYVVQKWGAIVAAVEAEKGPSTSGQPQRILFPLLTEHQCEPTLDFIFALRGEHSEEAVYPVTVVSEDDETGKEVVIAEQVLEHTVHYAAGADVNVIPMTRVASDTATGIIRAVVERRISDLVFRWDGARPKGENIFGHIIDETVLRSPSQVFIVHLQHPVNTTARVVVLLTPGVEESPGYRKAVADIKKLAHQLGARITGIALNTDVEKFERHFESMAPTVGLSFVGFDDWELMLTAIGERMDDNDLAMVVLPRMGTEFFKEEYTLLATRLAKLVPGSFALMFPSTALPLQESLGQERLELLLSEVRYELLVPTSRLDGALLRALELEFHLDQSLPRRLADELLQAARFSTVTDDHVLMHARIDNLPYPLSLIITRPEGLEMNGKEEKARILIAVFSNAEVSERVHQNTVDEWNAILAAIANDERLLTAAEKGPFRRRVLAIMSPEDDERTSDKKALPA